MYEDDIQIVSKGTGASLVLAPPGRWQQHMDSSDPDSWSVWCVRVPQEHRHKGVATELLKRALAEAKARGALTVRLACMNEITGLYSKVGFEVYEHDHDRVNMETKIK